MGTTVSTNLSLIKPDINESIQPNLPTFPGWTVQQGLNADKIDSLFRHSAGTYTPTWTADTTNPTLGTGGFVEGKYIRLMPRLVLVHIRLFVGTTGFAAGVGLYQFSLPFAMAAELDALNDSVPVGRGFVFYNAATANANNHVLMYDTTSKIIFFRGNSGDYWRSTNPVAPGQNDRASGYFLYPTSAA